MNKAYDATLRADAKLIAKNLNMSDMLHEGIYTCLGGPNYETIAELRMLKVLGVDAVGKQFPFYDLLPYKMRFLRDEHHSWSNHC